MEAYWVDSNFELVRNCKDRFLHLWKLFNLILDVVTKAKLEYLNSIIRLFSSLFLFVLAFIVVNVQ